MTDEALREWLRRMSDGDKEAFHHVYDNTKDQVYRTVFLLVGHKQDTADVVCEVFGELFRSYASYRHETPFRSWLNSQSMIDEASYQRYQPLLNKRAAELKAKHTIWEKSPDAAYDKRMETPQLTYANSAGEEIYVVYHVMESTSKHSIVYSGSEDTSKYSNIIFGSGTAYTDEIEVNGLKGMYKRTGDNNLTAIFNNLQEVQWMKEQDKSMVLYQVYSATQSLTKEDLLSVATSMK